MFHPPARNRNLRPMLAAAATSDAIPRIAAFLVYEDLAAITRCCRAFRDVESSVFYRAWVAKAALVLPPDSLTSHEVLSTVTDINAVVVPGSYWLDLALADERLAPRLARVRHIVVQHDRFQTNSSHAVNLSMIAQVFPAATHLSIQRLEDVRDVRELRCFRSLRSLELVSREKNMLPMISAADFPNVEELKLTRIGFHMIESMERLTNLRSLKLREYVDTIPDLSFLKCMPKLTDLCLGSTTVWPTAIHDLLEVAPRLIHFECESVGSIWPSESTLDGVDAAVLARAFEKLETLIIHHHPLGDLSSVSVLESLRELQINIDPTVDLSPLQQLTRLERIHLVYSRRFTRAQLDVDPVPLNLAPLAALPHLVFLKDEIFGEDELGEPEPTSFRRLQVFEGRYKSVLQMKDLDSLRDLTITTMRGNQAVDFARLPAPRLRSLKLGLCTCGDMSDLHLRFPLLRHFHYSPTAVVEDYQRTVLSHVAQLRSLESLFLGSCPERFEFHRLGDLLRLRKVEVIWCNQINLQGVEILSSLQQLRMGLAKEGTIDLSTLEKLPRLQVLKITGRVSTDVTPLTRISSLHVVSLSESINCHPLVMAYHAARKRLSGVALELREVKHDSGLNGATNCLWGKHYHSIRVL